MITRAEIIHTSVNLLVRFVEICYTEPGSVFIIPNSVSGRHSQNAFLFGILCFCRGIGGKERHESVTDQNHPLAIPLFELENCAFCTRNNDFLTGELASLLYHVQFAGHYGALENFRLDRPLDNTILLLLTLKGCGRLTFRGQTYRMEPGTVTLFDAREERRYQTDGEYWEFKFLHLWGGQTEAYQSLIEQKCGVCFSCAPETFRLLEQETDRILRITEADVVEDHAEISRILYGILLTLLAEPLSSSSPSAEDGALRPGSRDAVRRAMLYIHQHYAEKLDTASLAEAVSLSRSCLTRKFTERYGVAPHRYLNEYRLRLAREKLANTDRPIGEIAVDTGFGDCFLFSRVFRRSVGMSPSQYRKQYSAVGDGASR